MEIWGAYAIDPNVIGSGLCVCASHCRKSNLIAFWEKLLGTKIQILADGVIELLKNYSLELLKSDENGWVTDCIFLNVPHLEYLSVYL